MSKEMKVIMENWRRNVITEGDYAKNCRASFRNAGDMAHKWTLAKKIAAGEKGAKELVDKLQTGADWVLGLGGALAATGIITGGAGAVLGGAVASLGGLGNLVLSVMRGYQNKNLDKNLVSHIFQALCIDPAILAIIENDVEGEIFNSVAPFNKLEDFFKSLPDDAPVPDLNTLFVNALNQKFLSKTDQSQVVDKN